MSRIVASTAGACALALAAAVGAPGVDAAGTHAAPESVGAAFPLVAPRHQDAREPGEVFQRFCAVCHGEEGEGNGPAAGSMSPRPADFTDAEKMEERSDEELIQVLTNGKGTMPSFGSLLSAEEIRAMVAYLRELYETEDDPTGGDS